MVPGETAESIKQEMDQLISGRNASWEIDTIHRKSWTGLEIKYEPFHIAWEIDLKHTLSKSCIRAYQDVYGAEPDEYVYWDYSTDAVTPVSMGIPTIGFGPGEYKLAHMRNENCEITQIIEACNFYTELVHNI